MGGRWRNYTAETDYGHSKAITKRLLEENLTQRCETLSLATEKNESPKTSSKRKKGKGRGFNEKSFYK